MAFPQTGTLSSLLTLSDALAKHDPIISAVLSKTVDSIKSLTTGSSPTGDVDRNSPLSAHLVIDDSGPYLDYIFPPPGSGRQWKWNVGKYRVESRPLNEVVEGLVKEVTSIENAQRNKAGQYALVKGQLTTALRKKTYVLGSRLGLRLERGS